MSNNQSRRKILQRAVIGSTLWLSGKSIAKDRADASERVSGGAADGHGLINRLVAALRAIDKPLCIQEADRLASLTQSSFEFDLHLRQAGLSFSDASYIADALSVVSQNNTAAIRSFSVSFNPDLQDAGVIALAKTLPATLREIGMVGCDFGDAGADALLSWAQEAPELRMICIEQNRLSEQMHQRFSAMSQRHGNMLVIT